MEWDGNSTARVKWTRSLDCHHLCMVLAHAQAKHGGKRFPLLAAGSMRDCFLPKTFFACGHADGIIELLSKEGDRIDAIDIPLAEGKDEGGPFKQTRKKHRIRALAVSPLDDTIAVAPFEVQNRVLLKRVPLVGVTDIPIPGIKFGLAFVASQSLLVVGHVDDDDLASVTIYDYTNSSIVASHRLSVLNVVDYMTNEPYDDIRSVDCDMVVSSNGLTFGAADGFNVLAFDLCQGLELFAKCVQPSGVVFSLDSDILTTASNDHSMEGGASLRLYCFEVPSGRAAYDHAMHGKRLRGTAISCPMMCSSAGLVLSFGRRVVLISPSGDVVFDFTMPEGMRQVVAWANIATGKRDNIKCVGAPYEAVIETVTHDENPATIGDAEAAAVASEQRAGFVEQNLGRTLCADAGEFPVPPQVHLCTLNRCPKELREQLCNGPELRLVRNALGAQRWLGPGGSLVFVKEEHFEEIMSETMWLDRNLKPSHLIVSEAFLYLVEEVIDKFKQCWCKSSEGIPLQRSTSSNAERDLVSDNDSAIGYPASGVEEESRCQDVYLSIDSTFVHIMRDTGSAGQWTESTTGAHCPGARNPRMPSRQL
mmetsp:Transcript_31143/g.87720  ORF Transcript_31143/g.87720 Transcript_31143/m.87720 type:complete len:592 (+) Transcript_31143:73-1848(+)|eukprot:CAMPEP_0179253018 /NCGR_PEP_ID=MMETSP0797-20121207/22509_1 /TAXON_ID=47934 /ORGANISM="Dinophysis acuminata, Strain DAEP01" /LENGTH=591 /DNA_ID=CAMNT_0020960857 /DNA_START=45 /DNA_END=1820 /DNA_ORIENTATION=-